jgi:AcrR family transcriptional regulator
MAPKTYDQRLDSLLSTAARVFAAKGYHPTTMRDLARETGMSLAGMYHYVRGKDELLALVQERCFSGVLEGAEAAVAAGGDPAERLERFIRHHVTFFAEHMPEMKVLSHEAESLSVERREAIDGLKGRYVDLLLSLLEEAGIGANGRAGRKVAAYALFGMMNWIYTWYDPDGAIGPDALAEQFTGLFLRGVAPERATGAVTNQNQRG